MLNCLGYDQHSCDMELESQYNQLIIGFIIDLSMNVVAQQWGKWKFSVDQRKGIEGAFAWLPPLSEGN